MIKRDKILKHLLFWEGGFSPFVKDKKTDELLICSECFQDEGLKLVADSIGIQNPRKCPNCYSINGKKLTKQLVHKLCYLFFVRGTIVKFEFGGCPTIQFNEQHFNQSEIQVSPWLSNDLRLLEKVGKIGLFKYGPRLWMTGNIEPLKGLQKEIERDQIINKILNTFPNKEISNKDYFYRIRINPKNPSDVFEYDSAPDFFLGLNRFDHVGFPVLYGSSDLELCIHECRVSVDDNLFVGKLVPNQKLNILDLSVLLEEKSTEFESLDIAIHFLFLAGQHSYPICRQIAKRAQEYGYDGIIYPSYFSYLKMGSIPFDTIYGLSIRRIPQLKNVAESQGIPNIALFGHPVKENKINVTCINKVILKRVSYELTFGPVLNI